MRTIITQDKYINENNSIQVSAKFSIEMSTVEAVRLGLAVEAAPSFSKI